MQGWITIRLHNGWNLFHSSSLHDFHSWPEFWGSTTGRLLSFRIDHYSAVVYEWRVKKIYNSSHLLQLVVFGVLHRSCYGVSFGSRYEFIQRYLPFWQNQRKKKKHIHSFCWYAAEKLKQYWDKQVIAMDVASGINRCHIAEVQLLAIYSHEKLVHV